MQSEMQVASLHISSTRRNGKSTHAFGAASRPSRAQAPRPRRVRSSPLRAPEVFRRAVDIDEFDIPAAVVGEPGPPKYMRRDRDRGAPQLDHPNEFLDRRPYIAVSPNAARAMTGATSAALPRDALLTASAGIAHVVPDVFAMRGFARRRPDNPQRRRRLRRSHWSAPACRAMRAG